MPKSVTYDQLESGVCREYWRRGRLTWTQAKLLKKGDWLLVYCFDRESYTGKRWMLGKFHSRARYYGGDAVRIHLYPEDMHDENLLYFYMHSLKIPDEGDLEDVSRWGCPLKDSRREGILKRRALKPEKQAALF